MRPLRMKPFKNAVDEVFPVIAPFVKVAAKKRGVEVRQQLAPRLPRLGLRPILRIDQQSDFIKERFVERPYLTVRSRPVAAGMGVNRLIEMPQGRSEVMMDEQGVDFIIGRRKIEGFRKRAAQSAIVDCVAVARQGTNERARSLVGRMNLAHGLFDDKIAKLPAFDAFVRMFHHVAVEVETARQHPPGAVLRIGQRVERQAVQEQFEQGMRAVHCAEEVARFQNGASRKLRHMLWLSGLEPSLKR